MEKIEITIKADGSVTLDCGGFVGTRCNITQVVEEALGLIDREDKSDLFKNELQMNEFDTLG